MLYPINREIAEVQLAVSKVFQIFANSTVIVLVKDHTVSRCLGHMACAADEDAELMLAN